MRWDPMPSARDLAPTAFKDWEVLCNEPPSPSTPP